VRRPPPPPRLIADFRAGVPDLASFPRSDWLWATRQACGSVATADLDNGDPRGSARLNRCGPPGRHLLLRAQPTHCDRAADRDGQVGLGKRRLGPADPLDDLGFT